MGGSYSGWYGRRSRRHLVEDCLTLDINALRATGALTPGDVNRGEVEWWRTVGSDLLADMGFVIDATGNGYTGRASFTYEMVAGSIRDDVTLCTTVQRRQPMGGLRWWFQCPRCGRRCGKLYRPFVASAHFACRRCHGLAYRSEALGVQERARRRVRQLYAKIGSTPSADYHWRPRRMRWATFERRLDAAMEAEEYSDSLAMYSFFAIAERLKESNPNSNSKKTSRDPVVSGLVRAMKVHA